MSSGFDSQVQHELERSLCGSLLLDPKNADRVSLIVEPQDFLDSGLGSLYGIITGSRDAGLPCDVKSILVRCRDTRCSGKTTLELLGGFTGIATLRDATPHAANVIYHAQELRKLGVKRRLIRAAQEIIEEANDPSTDPVELVAMAEHSLSELNSNRDEVVTLSEAIQEAVQGIKARIADRGKSDVCTGLVSLDSGLGPLNAGYLIVLGARPSDGKTAFGMQVCTHNSSRGRRALFISLEMRAADLGARTIAAELGESVRAVRSGAIPDEKMLLLDGIAGSVDSNGVFLWGSRAATVSRIKSVARMLRATKQIELVCVDYLGLIVPEDRRIDRHLQVAEIVAHLKSLAMELEVPVMLLCQLSRRAESATPTLTDLRESGAIEQDADVVLLLHRKDRSSDVAQLEIAKVRNGEIGSISLGFHGATATFSDLNY